MHKLTGGWPCYGGAMDVLGRLISVFGAASATFGLDICYMSLIRDMPGKPSGGNT